MAVLREETPYGAFNYIVALGGEQGTGDDGQIVGGFSDVSGLGVDVSYSDYRNGNEKVNTARKVPNTFKLDDVTLKRGLVGSIDLFNWLKGVRDGTADPRDVSITLLDEARNPVQRWLLRNAWPVKIESSPLNAQGNEVVIETLELAHEGFETE